MQLKKLLELADEIEANQQEKMAWRLIRATGYSLIVGLGGMIAAAVVIWEVVQKVLGNDTG